MNVRRIGYRYQRTLLRSTEVVGIGFLTGAPIRLRFNPAPPSTGVVFVRTDLQQPLSVAAQVGMVSGTQKAHNPRPASRAGRVSRTRIGRSSRHARGQQFRRIERT